MAPNELSPRGLCRSADGAASLAGLRAPSGASEAGVAVAAAGLAKSFGRREVLRSISLDVAQGEFLAIVGHSGCGKSTLLRLVAGLETPSRGRISVGGVPVAGQAVATRIMFQDARLLPWRRIIDNVGVGLDGDWKPKARATLRAVGLENRAGDWPAVLSGGQRQRIALARALVSRPKLLLLDEPLGALDALTRLEMQGLLEQVWQEQGFTALLVTHDVAEAVALADRVIVLDNGEIALNRPIPHARPRPRGDAALAAIEGDILAHLLRRGARAGTGHVEMSSAVSL